MTSLTSSESATAYPSEAELDRAVAEADPLALWATLVQLTGDERLRAMKRDTGEASWERPRPSDLADEADVAAVRSMAKHVLADIATGKVSTDIPTKERFVEVLEALLQEEVPREDLDWWWEEFAAEPVPRAVPPVEDFPEDLGVLVIGAGMSGLSVAVTLQTAGIPFTVIEKNAAPGGTWVENTYPGARVDVASRSYSYTFEPKHRWRHYYAVQSELAEYFEMITDKYGIRERIVYGSEVLAAHWSDAEQVWNVDLLDADGTRRSERYRVVISAVGLFNRPSFPDIAGLNTFAGKVVHSAQWDHTFDLTGKRVGIIGTGASGTQMVAPIAPQVAKLEIFQRSGVWVSDYKHYLDEIPAGEQWMMVDYPFYGNWARLLSSYSMGDKRMGVYDVDPEWKETETISEINSRIRASLMKYMLAQIGDRPDLVEKCTPPFPPLAKRLPKDNGWFAALKRDNVELVTNAIVEVVPEGIRTADGRVHELDAIILATGFRANDYLWPMEIVGCNEVSLAEKWKQDGARAYLGISVPGFPNLFCMYGPNTNPKTGGPCMWGEMQARYIAQCVQRLATDDIASIEVRSEIYEDFNRFLDDRLKNSIWMVKNQRSYYINDHNRVAVNAPWATLEYWHMTRTPNLDDYVVTEKNSRG